MLIMLHSLSIPCYIGCVEYLGEDTDDPTALIDGMWDSFNSTHPDSDNQFIEYLEQNTVGVHEADVNFDENLPLQMYLI